MEMQIYNCNSLPNKVKRGTRLKFVRFVTSVMLQPHLPVANVRVVKLVTAPSLVNCTRAMFHLFSVTPFPTLRSMLINRAKVEKRQL